jgi:hypothetical protein
MLVQFFISILILKLSYKTTKVNLYFVDFSIVFNEILSWIIVGMLGGSKFDLTWLNLS